MRSKLALEGGSPIRHAPFGRWPVYDDAEAVALQRVLLSGEWSFDGPNELEFARRFAEFCGAREALCVANGTVSLEMALRALDVGAGDEVIVPALTWVGSATPIVQLGAIPVFADVRADDWCLDPHSFADRITNRTKAVIVVHLYNQMAPMDEILAIAHKHRVAVIEDCAHAHGMQWQGCGAGTLGTIGAYSFQQSKVMTAGEGGALVTNQTDIAERLYSLKNCGRSRHPDSEPRFGTNYRMTEFQAAVLLAQLGRIEEQMATKATNAARFRAQLDAVSGIASLGCNRHVTRQGMYALPLRYEPDAFCGAPRELLLSALQAEGIPVLQPYDVVYRSPLWTSGLREAKFPSGLSSHAAIGLNAYCPAAEHIAAYGLVLLHHVFLAPPEDMADLAAGFAKVHAHADDLRKHVWRVKTRAMARSLLKSIAMPARSS